MYYRRSCLGRRFFGVPSWPLVSGLGLGSRGRGRLRSLRLVVALAAVDRAVGASGDGFVDIVRGAIDLLLQGGDSLLETLASRVGTVLELLPQASLLLLGGLALGGLLFSRHGF